MLQLRNTTPFAPAMAVLPNASGIDTLFIVVKGTFTLDSKVTVASEQSPPALTDLYWADPSTSSLKYATELHLGKPTTDVVLVGSAWSPKGRPAAESVAAVRVAGREKIVRVSGNRTWKSTTSFSSPEPFVSIPLVFERAFGGSHRLSDEDVALADERNPVGIGYLGRRSSRELIGQNLPNLEDPSRPLREIGDVSPPSAFAFIAPAWLPRRRYGGTYDQAWKRNRAPYLPSDFDARFFNSSASELTFERFLSGGEPVDLLGVSQAGPLRFALPQWQLSVDVQIAGSRERPPF